MNEHRKSPALAGVLSLMPGLGQIYLGYYVSGFIYAIVVAAIMTVLVANRDAGQQPLLPMFLTFFWMFNVIDAIRRANAYNQHYAGEGEKPAPTDSPLVGGVVLLIAGVIAAMHFTFGFDMSWLKQYWPLGLIGGGAYLVWKYYRVRRNLHAE